MSRLIWSIARQQWRARIETASKAIGAVVSHGGIARQQWRARIETWNVLPKPSVGRCIARQQWRARIETGVAILTAHLATASPASNGGRGLKQFRDATLISAGVASPASNGGRGLKL